MSFFGKKKDNVNNEGIKEELDELFDAENKHKTREEHDLTVKRKKISFSFDIED